MTPSKVSLSVRTVLILYSLAILTPVVLFSAVLLERYGDAEQGRIERQGLEIAKRSALAVDREVAGLVAALDALSVSTMLDTGDLKAFHSQAAHVAQTVGSDITLRDPAGRRLTSTRAEWGSAVPPGAGPEVGLEAVRTRQATVSNLVSRTGASPVVVISVPILRGERVLGVLNAGLSPDRLRSNLLAEASTADWTLSLVDRSDRIIARSSDQSEFLGKVATEDLRRNATGLAGTWVGYTLNGTPVVAAYARSNETGFRVAVGAPRAQIGAPARRSMMALLGFGLLALAVSVLAGAWLAQSLIRPLKALTASGAAIQNAQVIAPVRSSVAEVEDLSGTLVRASRALAEREHERSLSDAALKRSSDQLADERNALEVLNRTGSDIAAELDVAKVVQLVVDAGVELTGARFGAFFYNVLDASGGKYTLYALSGAKQADFEGFGMPRATHVFAPTFAGEGIVRSGDITRDPRYGRNRPHEGMPKGHLPVRSYLAVPVISRSGEVIGGLFFGHEASDIFSERSERLMTGLAAQAAIALDNGRLFEEANRANDELEERVRARTSELNKAHEQLQQAQKMQALGQLTGGIAHDFNNMLTVIQGSADMLQRPALKEERRKRLVSAILESASRAAALTSQLLAFARRQPLQPQVVSLNRQIEQMTDLLSRTLGERIAIHIELDPEEEPVRVDPAQLQAAMLNVAVNARDAMPDGGDLTIRSRSKQSVNDVPAMALSIADTGSGMDADTLRRVVEPFFTTKQVGKGTGLGLSQVDGFASQSGGALRIESEPGAGTTVTLLLPCSNEEIIPADSVVATPALTRADGTVLLVDDHEEVGLFAEELLEELGYTVLRARSGEEALALFEVADVDVLFSDVVMPGMSGVELAAKVRALKPSTKIILTTGYSPEILESGTGGLPVLQKPYAPDKLIETLQKITAEENK